MRPALWYLLFVGVPVLALLGVLQLGQGLTPPRAVHGLYTVTFDSSASGSCLAELRGPAREITISQSGPRLDLKLGDLVLTGTIAGDSVRAGARGDAVRRSGCLTVDTIVVTAAAQRRGNERELAGQLLFHGCPNCSPVPFRAVRVPERSRNRGLDA